MFVVIYPNSKKLIQWLFTVLFCLLYCIFENVHHKRKNYEYEDRLKKDDNFKRCCFLFIVFLKILFIFREMGREGEREGEKYQSVVASHTPPTGDPACNPSVCRLALSPLSHTSQGLISYFTFMEFRSPKWVSLGYSQGVIMTVFLLENPFPCLSPFQGPHALLGLWLRFSISRAIRLCWSSSLLPLCLSFPAPAHTLTEVVTSSLPG